MKHFFSLLLLISSLSLSAQTSILAEKIDIRITDRPLEEVLQTISKVGDFFFSYNASILPLGRKITLNLRNTAIREVLNQVIDDPFIQYKEIGNHIILNKISRPQANIASNPVARIPVPTKPKTFTLSGFIEDSISGRRLAHASILESSQSLAAVSDENGFYSLTLAASKEDFQFSISHRFYEAHTFTLRLEGDQRFSAKMIPRTIERVSPTANLIASSAEINPIQDVFLVRQFVKIEYLQEPLPKDEIVPKFAQLSFIPLASTNGLTSYQKTNRFSLNVLAGYSAGVRGVEIGGLMNIDRNEVRGLQMAGLGNVVGGNTNGLQMSGIFNVNRRSVNGAQLAGINNLADSLIGLQASPINNVLLGRLYGVQATAIVNVSVGEILGTQAAGIFNWGKTLNGAQLAGIANVATDDFQGAQISGIFNYAKKGRGLQMGLINVADSLDGVAVGLWNFIKHGYNGVEVGSGLTLPMSAKLKMGNHKLYNIFAMGTRPWSQSIWGYGYGLGNAAKVSKKSYLHTELMAWHIHQDQTFVPNLNLLTQLNLSYHSPLSSRFEISLGPVLNFHVSKYIDSETDKPLSVLNPYGSTPALNDQELITDFWLGGQIGITLLKGKGREKTP